MSSLRYFAPTILCIDTYLYIVLLRRQRKRWRSLLPHYRTKGFQSGYSEAGLEPLDSRDRRCLPSTARSTATGRCIQRSIRTSRRRLQHPALISFPKCSGQALQLQTALSSIAGNAEHLTVFSDGLADFEPRLDVVTLHLTNLENMLAVDVDRVVAGGVTAEVDGALLAVENLEAAVLVDRPIHDVEREPFADRVSLLGIVDELALVFRSDVELAVVADDAFLVVVAAVLRNIEGRDLFRLDFYDALPILLITTRWKRPFIIMRKSAVFLSVEDCP